IRARQRIILAKTPSMTMAMNSWARLWPAAAEAMRYREMQNAVMAETAMTRKEVCARTGGINAANSVQPAAVMRIVRARPLANVSDLRIRSPGEVEVHAVKEAHGKHEDKQGRKVWLAGPECTIDLLPEPGGHGDERGELEGQPRVFHVRLCGRGLLPQDITALAPAFCMSAAGSSSSFTRRGGTPV